MEEEFDPKLQHLFDSTRGSKNLFNVYDKDVLNLSVGAPGPDILQDCNQLMIKATQHRLAKEKEDKNYLFQYGPTSGHWECRDELAKFLSRRYDDFVARQRLVLSCGATHGMQIILNTVIAPNGVIFVEQFTYMIALELFKQFPLMKIVQVPMENDVVDLNALENLVEKERNGEFLISDTKIFWAMFYTIPTFHNPTGSVLENGKCKQLVNLARKHNLVVVCDDVYNVLNYEKGFPPHRLAYFDDSKDADYRGGNVISNGSFSKIIFPAIRLGWMECHEKIVKIIRDSGIMKSGGAVNHYVSGVVASALELGLQDEFLENLIVKYKERLDAVCEILDQNLPSSCCYTKPKGGYFIWLKLAKGLDGGNFNTWCQENCKVVVIPGARFSISEKSTNSVRLSFAFHSVENLRKATFSLCQGLELYIKKQLES